MGYRFVELDSQRRSVTLRAPGMALDFGAIAKGIAADAALHVLRAKGLPRAMVAAGGDIAVGDAPPGATGWRIEVPGYDSTIVLANRGVSTSGGANQYVEIGGVRYSHIVDPRTGRGVTRSGSVTVIAPTATESDGLATALWVIGKERGSELAKHQGVDALWLP